jgi:coenzyme F420-dependent glucose-6-phosphate dehydrogenase
MTVQRSALQIGYVAATEQYSAPDLVEYGVLAEQAGFDVMWASDHFHPWQDNQGHAGQAWLTLAALGQRTRRIVMGTGVTCPTYRYNPAIVAQAFATLGVLYPGRVFLGTGTGEAINELTTGGGWGPYKERAARLREALALINRLWTEDWVTFEGQYYTVREAKIYDKPAQKVPLYVAASGPRTARLAGECSDGLITVGGVASIPLHRIMDAFAEGATSAGKDAATMPRLCEMYVVAGTHEECLPGAELWQFIGNLEGMVENPDPRAIERLAKERVDLQTVARQWLVSLDPQEHLQALLTLEEQGFTHVFLHPPQLDQRRFIAFYGEHVLPAWRSRAGR